MEEGRDKKEVEKEGGCTWEESRDGEREGWRKGRRRKGGMNR